MTSLQKSRTQRILPADHDQPVRRLARHADPSTRNRHRGGLLDRRAKRGIGTRSDLVTSGAILILFITLAWSLAVWSLDLALRD